jgi:spore germination protein YaaH
MMGYKMILFGRRWLTTMTALTLLFAFVAGCGTQRNILEPSDEDLPEEIEVQRQDLLRVSAAPDRANPTLLADRTVAGNVYVFVPRQRWLRQVEFHVDGRAFSTERVAPFDLAGTKSDGTAKPWRTAVVGNGQHTITAILTFRRGKHVWTSTTSAILTVNNSTTPKPPESPAPTAGLHSIGYLPFWMHSSGMASIRENHQRLTEISPFWYNPNPDGSITHFADGWYVRDKPGIISELRDLGLKITPTLANLGNGGFDQNLVGNVLRNHRAEHIANIVSLVTSQGYDGIDIDYERVADADREVFIVFIRDLAGELHARGKTLSVASYAKTSEDSRLAYDLAELGRYADQVRLMIYNYHWRTSSPGSIAPLDFVNSVLTYASSKMPKKKLVAGFGFFGIDWVVGGSGRELTYAAIMDIARRHGDGAVVRRDGDGTPWFRYNDGGRDHEVWFEDERSIAAKQDAAAKHGAGGVMFWHLGGEDARVWQNDIYFAGATD